MYTEKRPPSSTDIQMKPHTYIYIYICMCVTVIKELTDDFSLSSHVSYRLNPLVCSLLASLGTWTLVSQKLLQKGMALGSC